MAAWDKAPPIDGEVGGHAVRGPSSEWRTLSRNLRIRSAVLGTDCRPRLARCAGGIDPCHERQSTAFGDPIANSRGSRISCPGGMVPVAVHPVQHGTSIILASLELEIDLGRGSLRHVGGAPATSAVCLTRPLLSVSTFSRTSALGQTPSAGSGFQRRSHSPSTTRPTAGTVPLPDSKLLMCLTSAPSSE